MLLEPRFERCPVFHHHHTPMSGKFFGVETLFYTFFNFKSKVLFFPQSKKVYFFKFLSMKKLSLKFWARKKTKKPLNFSSIKDFWFKAKKENNKGFPGKEVWNRMVRIFFQLLIVLKVFSSSPTLGHSGGPSGMPPDSGCESGEFKACQIYLTPTSNVFQLKSCHQQP